MTALGRGKFFLIRAWVSGRFANSVTGIFIDGQVQNIKGENSLPTTEYAFGCQTRCAGRLEDAHEGIRQHWLTQGIGQYRKHNIELSYSPRFLAGSKDIILFRTMNSICDCQAPSHLLSKGKDR